MQTIWYLYIIRTARDRLYTGITTDLQRRLAQHQSGCGAKALRGQGPLTLVGHWKIANTRSKAQQIEYRVKQLTRLRKLQLLTEYPQQLELWLHTTSPIPAQ